MAKRKLSEKVDAFPLPEGKLRFISGFLQGESARYNNYVNSWLEVLLSYVAFVNRQFPDDPQKLKQFSPKVGFFNTRSDYFLICADIDEVPSGYDDFGQLRVSIKKKYGNKAIVLESFRGKAKILFLGYIKGISKSVTLAKRFRIMSNISKEFVSEHFVEAGIKCDLRLTALKYTYVNKKMIDDLRAGLSIIELSFSCSIEDAIRQYSYSEIKEVKKETVYQLCDEEIDWSRFLTLNDFMCFVNPVIGYSKDPDSKKEMFIRLLISFVKLANQETGYDLPTTEISRVVFGDKKNHKTISRWLERLVTLRELEPIKRVKGQKYLPGVKGYSYRARVESEIYVLIVASKRYKDKRLSITNCFFVDVIPARQPEFGIDLDNCSYDAIKNAIVYYNGSREKIFSWFYSCIGHNDLVRIETLERLLRYFIAS